MYFFPKSFPTLSLGTESPVINTNNHTPNRLGKAPFHPAWQSLFLNQCWTFSSLLSFFSTFPPLSIFSPPLKKKKRSPILEVYPRCCAAFSLGIIMSAGDALTFCSLIFPGMIR